MVILLGTRRWGKAFKHIHAKTPQCEKIIQKTNHPHEIYHPALATKKIWAQISKNKAYILLNLFLFTTHLEKKYIVLVQKVSWIENGVSTDFFFPLLLRELIISVELIFKIIFKVSNLVFIKKSQSLKIS